MLWKTLPNKQKKILNIKKLVRISRASFFYAVKPDQTTANIYTSGKFRIKTETLAMIIREATLNDSAAITTHLLSAMEDIVYKFIGEENPQKAEEFLYHFVSTENNQYSYMNCVVAEENQQIIAAASVYEGARLEELRAPVIEYVRAHHNKNFAPEDETQAGEYYLDSLGVSPEHRGKGIGSKMLQFLIDKYVVKNHQTLGLLVEAENAGAMKLYSRLGFKPVATKQLVGKQLFHLQINESCL